jgi:hypothetical protein
MCPNCLNTPVVENRPRTWNGDESIRRGMYTTSKGIITTPPPHPGFDALRREDNRRRGYMDEAFRDIRGFSRRLLHSTMGKMDRREQCRWNDAMNHRSYLDATKPPVSHDAFFDPPGTHDVINRIGPPRRNLGLKSRYSGPMDWGRVPRLPKTTSDAMMSFVPLFVPIILNYEL